VIFKYQGPESLGEVVESIGAGVKAGTTNEAAAADIVLLDAALAPCQRGVFRVGGGGQRES